MDLTISHHNEKKAVALLSSEVTRPKGTVRFMLIFFILDVLGCYLNVLAKNRKKTLIFSRACLTLQEELRVTMGGITFCTSTFGAPSSAPWASLGALC